MHSMELFTTWVGLSIICEYPAEDVRDSSSCWVGKVNFPEFEQRALESSVALPRSKSKITQKFLKS